MNSTWALVLGAKEPVSRSNSVLLSQTVPNFRDFDRLGA